MSLSLAPNQLVPRIPHWNWKAIPIRALCVRQMYCISLHAYSFYNIAKRSGYIDYDILSTFIMVLLDARGSIACLSFFSPLARTHFPLPHSLRLFFSPTGVFTKGLPAAGYTWYDTVKHLHHILISITFLLYTYVHCRGGSIVLQHNTMKISLLPRFAPSTLHWMSLL